MPYITSKVPEHARDVGRAARAVEPRFAFAEICVRGGELVDVGECCAVVGHACQEGVVEGELEDICVFVVEFELHGQVNQLMSTSNRNQGRVLKYSQPTSSQQA